MKFAIPLIALCLTSPLHAQGGKVAAKDLGELLLDPKLQETTLEAVERMFLIERTEQEKRHLEMFREMLKRNGQDPGEITDSAFVWLTSQHDGLRAEAKTLTLWTNKLGEVVVNGADGKVSAISISLYNRGDDGDVSPAQLREKFGTWKTLIEEKTGVRGETRKSTTAVAVEGFQWRKGDTAFLLEASISKNQRVERSEFLRIRVASVSAAAGNKVAGRSTLKSNVVRKDDGDVFIENFPMVDQGQKGYCAVASIARVAAYYGLSADQHEIAQLANTSVMGTSPEEMEEAFKVIVGKLNIRTTKHYELTERQFEADVRAYNQLAKKQGKEEFKAPRGHILLPAGVWSRMDPAIFAEVKGEQSGCKRFMSKVKEYVEQGIPLAWCLRLGMFPEPGIPQQAGGHMRLIIGYNDKTQEVIYTDSWGKGHEFKKMPLNQAYAMSMCMYTMSPTR